MLFSRVLLCSHLPFVRSLLWVVTLSASYYRRRGRKVLEWFPIYVSGKNDKMVHVTFATNLSWHM